MTAIGTVPLTPQLTMSRIGYGGSRLHYLRRPADRQALLAAALDHGITHFDVAPLYGHGLAERELGVFLKGRRDALTVATKWGLATPGFGGQVPRPLSFHAAALATLARKVSGEPVRPTLPPALLQKSLQGSLKRLGTDYVDLYLMHEPMLVHLPDPLALCEALNALRTEGLIRAWGVAG
ncbi:MAG: aldo/keto reductase, partial [Pseudomonadota bacterium]